MPTQTNDILGIMLGLIALLILIKHLLPSLSMLFKEKIMGIRPAESFDLDQMIQKKINLYQLGQGEKQSLFEKTLELNYKKEGLEFVQSLAWDSQKTLGPLLAQAQLINPYEHPLEVPQLIRTFEQLIEIEGLEKGPAIEVATLKKYIIFYSIFFPLIDSHKQRSDFYHKTFEEVAKSSRALEKIVKEHQADFSVPS